MLDELIEVESRYRKRTSERRRRCLDARRVLARFAEDAVQDKLRGRGFSVRKMGHKERFDLLADGLRVEVKAARWDGRRYGAALRSNEADVLVMVCFGDGQTHHFIIPFDQVRGLRYFKITARNPVDYGGRFAPFLGAWDVLDNLASSCARQLTMAGVGNG